MIDSTCLEFQILQLSIVWINPWIVWIVISTPFLLAFNQTASNYLRKKILAEFFTI